VILPRCLAMTLVLLALCIGMVSQCLGSDIDKKMVADYICQLPSSFKPSTLKALWWVESNWDMDAEPDIGIGQINEKMVVKFYPQMDVAKLRSDWKYNLRMSNTILEDKLKWVRWRKKQPDWDSFCNKYGLLGMSDGDIALLAYNGMRKNHCFVKAIRLGKLRYYK